jgi:phosphatidylglycerol:prolipoprotein diacylglycerol transferase
MWPNIPIEIGNSQGQIPLYGLMIGLGLITLFLGVDFVARRQERDPEYISRIHYCLLAAFLGGLGSALILTKLIHGAETPWGNMAAMPGILGGAIALFTAARFWRVPLNDWLPIALPFFCFAHAWGRLGCFLGGCCFGQPTNSILGIQFPSDSLACSVHGPVSVHPTQLYELLFLVALGAALHFVIPNKHRLSVYLLAYGIGRFCIELVRGDNRGSIDLFPGLSPSQHICLLFIISGILVAWWQSRYQEPDPL